MRVCVCVYVCVRVLYFLYLLIHLWVSKPIPHSLATVETHNKHGCVGIFLSHIWLFIYVGDAGVKHHHSTYMEVHFQRSNLREVWENTHNVLHACTGIHIWLYFHIEITKQTNTKHDDFLEEGKNGGENRIHTPQNTSCSLDLLGFGNSAQLYSNHKLNNKMKR